MNEREFANKVEIFYFMFYRKQKFIQRWKDLSSWEVEVSQVDRISAVTAQNRSRNPWVFRKLRVRSFWFGNQWKNVRNWIQCFHQNIFCSTFFSTTHEECIGNCGGGRWRLHIRQRAWEQLVRGISRRRIRRKKYLVAFVEIRVERVYMNFRNFHREPSSFTWLGTFDKAVRSR